MHTGARYFKTVSKMIWFMALLLVIFTAGCDRDHGADLVSIEITPPNPSIVKGTTMQFTATGIYSNNTNKNLTSTVTWSSSAGSVATISNAAGSYGLATSVAVGPTTITATLGPVSGTTTLTVTNATLSSIAVTPTNPSIANGTTKQFTATGTYSDSTTQNITLSVTWSSSTGSVATISNTAGSNGLATSVAVGSTTIRAALGIVSGTTTLNVTNATLSSIAVTPTNPSIVNGLTKQFIATGTYSDATTQDISSLVTWNSSTLGVATISNATASKGLATSVAPGSTTITATLGVSGTTTLTVTNATLSSIVVTPVNPSIARGLTKQFIATGTYSNNTTQIITSLVTWSSSTVSVATISNAAGSNGLATSAAAGSTTITATLGAVSGTTTLTVTNATLSSIVVTPVNPSIAKGLTRQFTATGIYSDASTQDISSLVTWSSSNGSVATISNAAGSNGLATSIVVGFTTIKAIDPTTLIEGTTILTVTNAVLTSLDVTPVNPSIANGRTQQFTATGTFSDLTTLNMTSLVTWSSSSLPVATISNAAGSKGLATALASSGSDTTTITATDPITSTSGNTTLTVTNAVLNSIAVTPANPSIAVGATQQFIATGTFTSGPAQDLTSSVTWSTTNGSVATIGNAVGFSGLATAVSAGTTTIIAIDPITSVTGTTTLTVTAVIVPYPLGILSPFAIAAYGGLTNSGATTINGDVVLDPLATCNAVAVGAGDDFGLCGGTPPTNNAGDLVITQTHPDTTTADAVMVVLLAKWNGISPAGMPGATVLGCGTIGTGGGAGAGIGCASNATLPAGVYISASNSTINVTGDLTLDGGGDPNALFVLQAPSALTTAVSSRILLTNGAKASNVFWFVGSSASLLTGTEFNGNILASASITMGTGATSCGRLLAGAEGSGSFTFLANTVSVPGHPNAPVSCQ